MFREGLLDSGQIETDRGIEVVRVNQQMDVIGHENIGHKSHVELFVGFVEAPGKLVVPSIVIQQSHRVHAREREFMELARLVEMTNGLSIIHG